VRTSDPGRSPRFVMAASREDVPLPVPRATTRVHGGVQRAATGEREVAGDPVRIAHAGVADAGAPLPFLDQIQRSFGGHDVRGATLHQGTAARDAARSLDARAYTVGSRVAFAGTPDLHTAAHEAAHVVQQRGGVSLKGGLGAAGDAHERHADAVADRVVAGESAEALLDAYGSGGTAAEGVQRAVGFEWEVDALTLHEVTKKGDTQAPAHLPSKAVAFRRGGVRIEVDSGHGEFVTDPADTLNQVDAQLCVIRDVVDHLVAAGAHGLYMTAPGDIVHTDKTGDGKDAASEKLGTVWMQAGEWIHAQLATVATGTFQATSGVPFTAAGLRGALTSAVQHQKPAGKAHWEKVMSTADAAGTGGAGVKALIFAVEYFIAACANGTASEEDGPKTWMPLLLRTDFRSMFNALDAKSDQPAFTEWARTRTKRSDRLCPSGYKSSDGKQEGPTIGQWLDSIVAERGGRSARQADKDAMSPPPGFPRHLTAAARAEDSMEGKPVADPIPYAMGLYGMDGDMVIAEWRQMTKQGGQKSGRVGFQEMAGLAMAFAQHAGIAAQKIPEPPAEHGADDGGDMAEGADGVAAGDDDKADAPVVIDASVRNWYPKLCRDAKETVAAYGKGMFDYGTLGTDLDEVGETRLTAQHYELFGKMRAQLATLPFKPKKLFTACKDAKSPEDAAANYLAAVKEGE
jgi:hypothetical protein